MLLRVPSCILTIVPLCGDATESTVDSAGTQSSLADNRETDIGDEDAHFFCLSSFVI
jgi:hypothetical protein